MRKTRSIDPRRNKPYVIEISEGGKLLRIKVLGDRGGWYTVTWEDVYNQGARNKAIELRENLTRT
jgi:hypothetical protein